MVSDKRLGRHCAICGKPGGHPLTAALKLLGVPGHYAHSDCIVKTRKVKVQAQRYAQRSTD